MGFPKPIARPGMGKIDRNGTLSFSYIGVVVKLSGRAEPHDSDVLNRGRLRLLRAFHTVENG